MKILLVANHPDDARSVESALTEAGHSITTCNDDQGGPCRGVSQLDSCPLESSVDVAVVARSPHSHRGLEEMGAICAARHRIGVVEIDASCPSDQSIYDLSDAAERAICHDYERTIMSTLREAMPDDFLEVEVRRHDRDVQVLVTVAPGATTHEITAVADRARAGVRRHDHFAQRIDVSVRRSA
jgi:hypothetical protein